MPAASGTIAVAGTSHRRCRCTRPPTTSPSRKERPSTPRYGQGLLKPLDEDVEIEMADRIQHTLAEAGLERYEISNYARPGLESRHNVNYWEGGDYLGVGAGAHSHHRKPDDRWESAGRTSGRRPVT